MNIYKKIKKITMNGETYYFFKYNNQSNFIIEQENTYRIIYEKLFEACTSLPSFDYEFKKGKNTILAGCGLALLGTGALLGNLAVITALSFLGSSGLFAFTIIQKSKLTKQNKKITKIAENLLYQLEEKASEEGWNDSKKISDFNFELKDNSIKKDYSDILSFEKVIGDSDKVIDNSDKVGKQKCKTLEKNI